MEDEKIVVLRKPVTLGTVTYSQIELREPVAKELDKASREPSNVASAIVLISAVAKIPRGAVELLTQRDLQECSDFLGSFGKAGETTGEIGSPD